MSDPITVSALLAEPELSSYSRERFVTDFADVIEFDFLGRPAVARDVAKEILDELRNTAARIAEQQAQRRAATAAKHGTSIATLRRRLSARAEVQQQVLADDPTMPALAVLLAGDTEAKLTARGERDARMRDGESWGATFGKGID